MNQLLNRTSPRGFLHHVIRSEAPSVMMGDNSEWLLQQMALEARWSHGQEGRHTSGVPAETALCHNCWRDKYTWRTTLEKSCAIMKTRLFKYIENFTTKNWKFSDKNSDIFHISPQNTDCGYSLEPPCWGSSNEYPQSMFFSRNKKHNVYPCKPQFY